MVDNWLNVLVLHRRSYRETSMLVDFYSLEEGKVSAVAKGVRSAKSERRSLLQPFQPLRVQLTGKSDLKTLKVVEAKGQSIPLPGMSMFCGLYLNEILNRVLPSGMSSETLYETYVQSLISLGKGEPAEPILRQTEFTLLHEMGVMPDLTTEMDSGEPIAPEGSYSFDIENGLLRCETGFPGAYSGEQLLAMGEYQWTPQSLKAAKRLCRAALHPLLGEKPLKSRELFIGLNAMQPIIPR